MIIIPARSGSKRIPGKNIKPLNGKPLLFYSIESGLTLSQFVYVSTDSPEYQDLVAQNYPEVHLISRPTELSSDDSTDLDVIKHALFYSNVPSPADKLVIYLRPTTPIRDIGVLRSAVLRFYKWPASSLRSIEELTESSFKTFTLDHDGLLCPIIGRHWDANKPNHLLPRTYKGNGYIDIFRVEQVLSGDLFGDRCLGFVTPPVIELDTPEQWEFAEYILKRGKV